MYRFDGFETSNQRTYNGMVIYSKVLFIDLTYCIIDGIATVFAYFMHRGQVMHVVFLYCSPQHSKIATICKYL